MDEIAEAIGRLRAGLDAIARQQDAMQIERGAQHSEALTRLADVQAQIHEIKHAQNNDALKFARIEQVVGNHQQILERHQQFTEAGMARLESQILANREVSGARLDELVAWRNRVYGAIAVIVIPVTVFGKDIWAALSHIVRRLWP